MQPQRQSERVLFMLEEDLANIFFLEFITDRQKKLSV